MSKEEKTQSLDEFKGWLRGWLEDVRHLDDSGIRRVCEELDRVVVPAQYIPPGDSWIWPRPPWTVTNFGIGTETGGADGYNGNL